MTDRIGANGRTELVFAIVGPLGTRLRDLSNSLSSELEGFGYHVERVPVSKLLERFPEWKPVEERGEDKRIKHLQTIANEVRARTMDGGVLARAAIAEIRELRMKRTGHPDRPASDCAFIIDQLKHPEEARVLKRTYGDAFYLIGGHASRRNRVEALARSIAESVSQPGQDSQYQGRASDLIETDDKSTNSFGQNMRDTYPQADILVDMNPMHGESKVSRFVELAFGHPFHTPTPEEYAMYIASAVSLRSSDENRQVGAAIVDITSGADGVSNVNVRAVGMNEVPRAGGRFYWDGESPDCRDQALLPNDRAQNIKIGILAELMGRVRQKGWLGGGLGNGDDSELAQSLLADLKGTQFMGIGEFSRPVHAEMAAIIDASRRGVSIEGCSIYVTTFPCHNCTKHIIAAGLKRVVYLEPYPKSRANDLYREELELDSADGSEKEHKVVFSAYSGVAPRQYGNLFSMSERGGKNGMNVMKWRALRPTMPPLYVLPHLQFGHVVAERQAIQPLCDSKYSWNPEQVCPSGEEANEKA